MQNLRLLLKNATTHKKGANCCLQNENFVILWRSLKFERNVQKIAIEAW